MKFVDYYQTMGVPETATADEIKKAYRRLARKYHPDVSKEKNAEAKFKELGEAYEVLKDPDKRAEYDQLRKYGGAHGDEFQPPPDWQSRAGFSGGGYTEVDPQHFSEFFEQIFGGRGGAHHTRSQRRGAEFSLRGEDIEYRIPVTLEEAYHGATRDIALQTQTVDEQGRVAPKLKTLKITIPKGVTNGQRIRLKGQGQPGHGSGANGDLYLQVELQSHPRFSADGKDVSLVLPITPWEAALGASIDVPTLGGKVKMNIPSNARAGQKLRLKGQGFPGNPPGDQYVVLQIAVPEARTEADRELFRKMEAQMPFNPRAQLEGIA